MKFGKLVGLVGGGAGIFAGGYFAITPVLQKLDTQAISGSEAGTSLAIISIIIGVACAVMGTLIHKADVIL